MPAIIQPIIGNPHPFNINLQDVRVQERTNRTFLEKIQNVALPAIFEYVKIFFSSISEAFYINMRYVRETSRIVCLSSETQTAEALLFKLGAFVVLHIAGFIIATVFVFHKKVQAMPAQLVKWAESRLNLDHLKRKNTPINVAHVPANITVSTLEDLYWKINFTNPNAPGYVSPKSLNESEDARGNNLVQYSPNDLHMHLQKFVHDVNNRTAIIGTPPAYATVQLGQFYQQIENGVRFSIDKITNDLQRFMESYEVPRNFAPYNQYRDLINSKDTNKLEAFKKANPEVVEKYGKYQEYSDLLQTRARIVIDTGIAGAHCGARYMGDAMETYYFHKGEGTERGSLKEVLGNFLAHKRLEIARSHIPAYIGRDTHHYAAYMANLGGVLGIPDTENVVEQLTAADRIKMLEHFFIPNPGKPNLKVYNSAYIKESVQAKITGEKSQTFRDLVFDWLKDQAGDWRKEEFDSASAKAREEVQKIAIPEQTTLFKNIEIFSALIEHVKPLDSFQALKAIADPKKSWSDFTHNLFALPEAKTFIDSQLGTLEKANIEKMKARNAFNTSLAERSLIPELQKIAMNETVSLEELKKQTQALSWAAEVNKVLGKRESASIAVGTLLECYNKRAAIETVLKDHFDRARRVEFLESLTKISDEEAGAVTVEKSGLKPAILEWVLVAHGILNPPEAVIAP